MKLPSKKESAISIASAFLDSFSLQFSDGNWSGTDLELLRDLVNIAISKKHHYPGILLSVRSCLYDAKIRYQTEEEVVGLEALKQEFHQELRNRNINLDD